MKQVSLKIDGCIAILGIERPAALNSLSRVIVNEMDVLIEELKKNHNIRCLIIHSEGNFAAGADIKDMVECDRKSAKKFIFSQTYNKIADLDIPVIAAIEGYALGGGMELAMAADIRIAGENAMMGFPETTLGIIPGAGGTIRVPRIIGEARAKELIFTGALISAIKAEKIGLVNTVVADNQVLMEAKKMAERISRNAPIAVKSAKKTIEAGLEELNLERAINLEGENWVKLFATEDQKEGMIAFIEKRKPTFKNK